MQIVCPRVCSRLDSKSHPQLFQTSMIFSNTPITHHSVSLWWYFNHTKIEFQCNNCVFAIVCPVSFTENDITHVMHGNAIRVTGLFEGNPPDISGFPSKRASNAGFDVIFDVRLNKRLNKHSSCRCFETPRLLLWRHGNHQPGTKLRYPWFCSVSNETSVESTLLNTFLSILFEYHRTFLNGSRVRYVSIKLKSKVLISETQTVLQKALISPLFKLMLRIEFLPMSC